jgi:hypothetical protein
MKSEKKGKLKTKLFGLVCMMYLVKIDQLGYPNITTALQTMKHAMILMLIGIPSSLKQFAFPLFLG